MGIGRLLVGERMSRILKVGSEALTMSVRHDLNDPRILLGQLSLVAQKPKNAFVYGYRILNLVRGRFVLVLLE